MKKYILLLIFIINILPNIHNNQITLSVGNNAYAQWNPWGTGCTNASGPGQLSGTNPTWWSIITNAIVNAANWIGQQFSGSGTSSNPSNNQNSNPWNPLQGNSSSPYNPYLYIDPSNPTGSSGGYPTGNPNATTGYGTSYLSCSVNIVNGQLVLDCTNLNFNVYNDCQGVAFGTAYIDSCNKCVGGTTGLVACKGYLDSNNIFVDSVRKQPCDSLYKKMGDSLYAFLQKPQFQDSLNKFKQNTAADTLEKAISFGTDSITGIFKTTAIKDRPDIGSGPAQIEIPFKWPDIKIYKMMHFHDNSLYTCFSAGDLYTLQPTYNNPAFHQINSHYAYGALDSSMFAMQIEDSLLYSQYLSSHPMSTTMNASHDYEINTNIGQDFLRVKNYFLVNLGLSPDEARTQATAFVYSKYNTGMTLFRKRKNEDKFTKINTKETIDAAGNKTYIPSNCL